MLEPPPYQYLVPPDSEVSEVGEVHIDCPLPEHVGGVSTARFNVQKGLWFCETCKKGGRAKQYAELTNQTFRARGRKQTTTPRKFRRLPKLTQGPGLGTVYYYFLKSIESPSAGIAKTRTNTRHFILDEHGGRSWHPPDNWRPYSPALDLAYQSFIESGHDGSSNVPLWFRRDSARTILIVDGEDVARTIHTLIGDTHDVITWAGGPDAVLNTDWSAIDKRDALLFANNESESVEALRILGEHLRERGNAVRHVPPLGEAGSRCTPADIAQNAQGEEKKGTLLNHLNPVGAGDGEAPVPEDSGDIPISAPDFPIPTDWRAQIPPNSTGLELAFDAINLRLRYNLPDARFEGSLDDGRTWEHYDTMKLASLREHISIHFASNHDKSKDAWFDDERWENSLASLADRHRYEPDSAEDA